MARPKKKPSDTQSYVHFPVMLNVTSDNVVTWYGGKSYYDCLSNIGQRDSYCMAAEREKDMRKTFDALTNAPPPAPKKKKRDVVKLEKQYGNMVRNLYRKKHISVEDLARQFGLNIKDVKMMVREE